MNAPRARWRTALRLALWSLPLVLVAGLVWVLDSAAGLRFALDRVDALVAGELSVERAAGSLLGPLDLEGVTFVDGGTRVTIARLHLDLHPGPLLLGRAQLIALDAETVRIAVTPDPNAPPFTLPERIELPLHVALERFTIDDLAVTVGDRPPLEIARLSGGAIADADGLRLDAIEVDHARGTLRGHAALGLARPYPVAGALDLTLQRPQAPLAIAATLGGSLEALELAVASAAPLAANAELTLRDLFSAPRASGTASCAALQPAALDPALADLAGATLDCALRFEAAGTTTRISGRLRYAQPGWAPALLDLTLRAAPDTLVLEQGRLAFEQAPLRATLKGRFALDQPAHPFALSADLTAVALPTVPSGPMLAATAQLALDGDLDAARATLEAGDGADGTLSSKASFGPRTRAYALDATVHGWHLAGVQLATAELQASGDPEAAEVSASGTLARGKTSASFQARGRLTPEALDLPTLEVQALGGRASGSARLALKPTLGWSARLIARDLDPGRLVPAYPGRVATRLAIDGTPQRTTLAISQLTGTMRERPVSGSAELRFGAGIGIIYLPDVAFAALDLTSGKARIHGSADARAVDLALEASDLADLLPRASGRLQATIAFDHAGAGEIALDGAAIAVGGLELGAATGTLHAPADGVLAGKLTLKDLAGAGYAADAVELGASGLPGALELTLDAKRGAATLALGARGTFSARGFEGTLERLDIKPEALAPWALTTPSALRIGGGSGVSIAHACLSDGHASGCIEGGWHPREAWRTVAKVEHLKLAVFGGFLARGLDYQGDLDLDLTAQGRGPEFGDAQAVLALTKGSIVLPARRGRVASPLLEFSGGRIELHRDARALKATVALELGGHGAIDASAEAAGDGPLEQRPLSGRLHANADSFALLPVLVPELKRLAGRFETDLTLSGTVGTPHYAGRLAFRDGETSLPRLGLALDQIQVELKGDSDALTLTGSARSGGTVQWSANLSRASGAWRANGRLWGEKFLVVDTPEAKVIASPAMLFDLDGRDLKVSGEVTVPKARLAPRSLSSAVQVSADEVIVDSEGAGADDGSLRVDARLRLKLGDDVKFDGFGLKSQIAGELTLTQHPDTLTLASGEVSLVDGLYEAYGQKLTIQHGRLLFSGGPVSNPGIDVRATRLIQHDTDEDVTVTIDVRGTLREPRTTVSAEPAMSPSDALAYLVLGRPLSESTDADQKTLSDAASEMKLSGGEFLAQQIGRQIGLDEVRISDSSDPTQAQLWLGTYLSPQLFVSYGMGLFEQFHTARVRYQVTKHWSVEAESGRESSADVKYTIER